MSEKKCSFLWMVNMSGTSPGISRTRLMRSRFAVSVLLACYCSVICLGHLFHTHNPGGTHCQTRVEHDSPHKQGASCNSSCSSLQTEIHASETIQDPDSRTCPVCSLFKDVKSLQAGSVELCIGYSISVCESSLQTQFISRTGFTCFLHRAPPAFLL